jgi:Protein of unknown function (DUF2637)
MNGIRIARNLSAGAVASIAAVASYEHMRQLAADYGQPAVIANLMPISVDGLIIVSTIAMADDKRSGRTVRWSARLAFVVGVVASIAANVLATPGGVIARLISAWPAVALLMVVEVLSRRGKTTHAEQPTPVPAPAPVPVLAVAGTDQPSPSARSDASPTIGQPTPAPAVPAPAPAAKPARPRSTRRPPSAEKVARAAAKLPGATVAQVAAKAGVSESTARRYLPAASRPAPGAAVASANPPRPAATPVPAAA